MPELRSCRPDELDEVLQLVNLVFRTSQGRPASIAADYPQIYTATNLDNIITVRESGRIRACVATSPMRVACGDLTLETLGVNCTTTHPEWRRRGLGELMIREIAGRATERGCDLVHLDAGVPEWYRDLEYEYGGRSNHYTIHRGNADLLPPLEPGVDVAMGNGDDAMAAAHRLHAAERLGTVRTLDESTVAYARSGGHVVTAVRNGEVGAYVYLREADQAVIEHGGRSEEVAAVMRHLFEQAEVASRDLSRTARADDSHPDRRPLLTVEVSSLSALDALLAGCALPVSQSYWHMFYLPNVAQTVAKLDASVVVESAGPAEFTLRRGAEITRYHRRQLVQLLFGPEARGSVAGGVVPAGAPVPLFTPYTDHV